jgi:outer membrane receptor protein involved in Fe transport
MPSEYYQDVYVSWTFENPVKLTVYGGATNLFDNTYPKVTTSLRNLTSSYDELGTMFFVGAKAKF